MIELHCVKTLSDSTFCYEVSFDRDYTVKEFLDFVMSDENKANWGYISIIKESKKQIVMNERRVAYNKMLPKHINISEYANAKIIKARANGGWGSMDYYLTINAK